MKRHRILILLTLVFLLSAVITGSILSIRSVPSGKTLIQNGGFEDTGAANLPKEWYTESYIADAEHAVYGIGEGRNGTTAAYIRNDTPNDTRFAQTISVQPNTLYCLHGYVKANTEHGHGANLSIEDVYAFSNSAYNTNGEWVELTLYGRTGRKQTGLTVFARLGGYSGEATGEAWFDDITLTRVAAVPAGFSEQSLTSSEPSGSVINSTKSITMSWILLVVCSLAIFALLIRRYKHRRLFPRHSKNDNASQPVHPGIRKFQPAGHMKWKDWLLLLGITGVYACLAFYHLGAVTAPQQAYTFPKAGETVVFDLGEPRDAFTILYYSGIHWSDNRFTIQTSYNGTDWSDAHACDIVTSGPEFKWHYAISGTQSDTRLFSGRYIKLTVDQMGLTLYEVLFRDEAQNVLAIASVVDSVGADPSALIDEQSTLSGEPGWFNSMYFDEIYHARTAYEHLHGLRTFETSHPPLGKVIMSWGIALFGMTPFGWRFAGALCGVLMLPCMYLLGRLLFQKRRYAVLPMLLLLFDCMHYSQTHIATIDSFVVLFILWSVYCMLRWLLDESATLGRALAYLSFSGLFFGMACASKWTGFYAGAGLAVLFFYGIWRRVRIIRQNKAADPVPSGGVTHLWIIIACSPVFFIVIPALIYYCSYIPYFSFAGSVTLRRVIDAAVGMYRYHSTPGLGMDHQFNSPWYEWPLSIRPIFFSRDLYEPPGYASSILSFGNPAVWWVGLPALLIVCFLFIRQIIVRNKPVCSATADSPWDVRIPVILICFFAQFLPWMLVPRGTYIYHYFASVPFVILCITLVFSYAEASYRKHVTQQALLKHTYCETVAHRIKKANHTVLLLLILYIILTAVVFALLFPYASGWMVKTQWLDTVNWFGNLYY